MSAVVKPEMLPPELPRVLITLTAAEWQVQECGVVERLRLAGTLDQPAQMRVLLSHSEESGHA